MSGELRAAMRDMKLDGFLAADMPEELELDLSPKMEDIRELAREDENYSAESMEDENLAEMAEYNDMERLLALGMECC